MELLNLTVFLLRQAISLPLQLQLIHVILCAGHVEKQ